MARRKTYFPDREGIEEKLMTLCSIAKDHIRIKDIASAYSCKTGLPEKESYTTVYNILHKRYFSEDQDIDMLIRVIKNIVLNKVREKKRIVERQEASLLSI